MKFLFFISMSILLWAGHSSAIAEESKTYTATGEAVIKFPHHHDFQRLSGITAELIADKERDAAEEEVLSKTEAKLKWDDREHGMAGEITFEGVTIPDHGYGYVRFIVTGKNDDGEFEKVTYSTRETLEADDDGVIDLRSVTARLRR